MPPPPSYIDITIPLSRTVTQAEFNGGTFGGAANTVWFRYIASVPIVLGMQTTSGGTFTPRTEIFESDGSTAVDAARNGSNGMWTGLTAAATYYVKITRNGGGASDFDFTSEFDTSPLDDDITLEPGDLIINDDQDRAGVVLNPDGSIKTYTTALPGGEMGAVLPNGVSIWHDFYGKYGSNKLAILAADLTYIAGVDAGVTGVNKPIITADATQFYVVNQAGDLWTVTDEGVETNTGYFIPLTHDLPIAMAVDSAGTTIYWVTEDEDGVIRTIDLGSFTDGSDFYTTPGFSAGVDANARTANNHPGDMFVLQDGSLVTWWYEAGTTEYHVIHISSGGSLLHDISFTSPDQVNHLARTRGSSSVLIWLYTTLGLDTGRFGTLTFSTGLITDDFTSDLFEDGLNMLDTGMFGISTSCTLLQAPFDAFALTVPEECCPCDCPEPTGPHGSPTSAPLPSHAGPILFPVDPLSWIPQCTGGGDVPTASDATDPESWVQ